ncbi:MAG: LacI family DNA-binding transcriptional regulator [Spirochaetaceae bacterium]
MNIRTLAKKIGMSHMTVSRALNGSPNVAPATRERVLSLARELGYELHGPARGLATGKTATIGILYPFHELRAIESWYTMQLMHDIRVALDHEKFDSIIAGYDTDTNGVQDIGRLISQRKVDAVVVIGYEVPRAALETLSERSARYLCVNPPLESWVSKHPRVVIDQELGGELAGRALKDNGCTHVAAMNEDAPQFLDRLVGFRRVWESYSSVNLADGRYETAYRTTQEHLHSLIGAVDGLFVGSDVSALGALNALQDAGVRVPDQVAVVGYDDIDSALYSRPALSTIHQPRVRVAECVANWVRSASAGTPETDAYMVELLSPWYVQRGTCS